MAKKRVFLDECLGRQLAAVFGPKAHVYTARDLGVTGVDDPKVIDRAVKQKCLIVTVNKDFVEYYKNHRLRKGSKVRYFYGLIFLGPSKNLSKEQQLGKALKEIAWSETRTHDDLISVYANGRTHHERLCHPECAEAFQKKEDS
jgi:predicted nuclease of predicted toxin-antitoxin system